MTNKRELVALAGELAPRHPGIVERTGRIELHPAWLGRPATQPVCLPAQPPTGWITAPEAPGHSPTSQRGSCANTKNALPQARMSEPMNGRGRSCTVAAAWMDTREY